MIFNGLNLFGTGICLTSVTDSGLPSISESDIAESVANDIQKLRPSVMMETLKKLYPFFLALAYDIVTVIITLIIASQVIRFLSNMLEKFLKKKIRFIDIPYLIGKALDAHKFTKNPSISDIILLKKWTEEYLERIKI